MAMAMWISHEIYETTHRDCQVLEHISSHVSKKEQLDWAGKVMGRVGDEKGRERMTQLEGAERIPSVYDGY